MKAKQEHLWRAADRACRHPFYLAWALWRFGELEGLDRAGLARFLGCREEVLPFVGLCRRPVPEPPERFRLEVETVAQRWGIPVERLAHLLRFVDSLTVLAGEVPTHPLLAAREREVEGGS